jgi:acyl-CoA thioester hydrolase/1,4-dihydroxy-2-naphthoyl-CoA hydrolase
MVVMASQFKKEIQLRFREADPAGILFFGNVFALAHDCFEDFIQAAGFTWQEWFKTKEYMIPIRHTESNYLKPFIPGDKYQITATVARIGDSSFQMKYIFSQESNIHADVRMTHTFLDAKTKQKISVPELVRNRLKAYLHAES